MAHAKGIFFNNRSRVKFPHSNKPLAGKLSRLSLTTTRVYVAERDLSRTIVSVLSFYCSSTSLTFQKCFVKLFIYLVSVFWTCMLEDFLACIQKIFWRLEGEASSVKRT